MRDYDCPTCGGVLVELGPDGSRCRQGHLTPRSPNGTLAPVEPPSVPQPAPEPTPEPSPARRPRGQRDELVSIAADLDLFHDEAGTAYASVERDGHLETYLVRSTALRLRLTRAFYQGGRGDDGDDGRATRAPSSQAIQDALNLIEARARFDGPTRPAYVRLAGHEGAVYLDLGRDDWRVVEVTADGWQVVEAKDAPVRFHRPRALLALPVPVPGAIEALRPFVNVADDDGFRLLVSWLVGALNPALPYPILILGGEQGSAKSTTATIARELLDPNEAGLRAAPKDEEGLLLAARNGWLLAFDNLSGISREMSDALCRLATGAGFAKRTLYTDSDETIINVRRPVCLNGIADLAARSDLLDRAIVLTLPPILEASRRTEAAFRADFQVARPGILGALLTGVARALRDRDRLTLPALPRMADFALWMAAAAPAFGWDADAALAAYAGNRAGAHADIIDGSTLGALLRDYLTVAGQWQGTARELLALLSERAGDDRKRQKDWPANPRTLATVLRRIAPNLRAVGIDVTELPGHKQGRRWRLERGGEPSSPSSPSSPHVQNGVFRGTIADLGGTIDGHGGRWGDDRSRWGTMGTIETAVSQHVHTATLDRCPACGETLEQGGCWRCDRAE